MEATVLSTGELEKKSAAELVAIWNELNPEKPIKKFSDKATAVKRCLAAMSAQEGKGQRTAPPASMPAKPDLDTPSDSPLAQKTREIQAKEAKAAAKEAKAKQPKKEKGEKDEAAASKRIQFNFKARATIKPHREGTKRARVLEMLLAKGGATFDEISAAIKWDSRTTFEGIKLIHTQLGYGLNEDPVTHKITALK